MTGEQLNKTLTDARPSIRDIFRLQEESDIENHPAKNWNPKEEVERLAKWQNVDKYFKYCDDKQLSFVFAKKRQKVLYHSKFYLLSFFRKVHRKSSWRVVFSCQNRMLFFHFTLCTILSVRCSSHKRSQTASPLNFFPTKFSFFFSHFKMLSPWWLDTLTGLSRFPKRSGFQI